MEPFEIMEGVKPEDIRYQKHPMPVYQNWLSYHILYKDGWKVYIESKAGSEHS